MSNQIKPQEISSILKKQIENLDLSAEISEEGVIIQVGDGIALAYGMQNVMAGEIVEIYSSDKVISGLVLNLEEDNIGIAILGESRYIVENSVVKRTGKVASVPVGEEILGRVLDGFGNPIDGDSPLNCSESRQIEVKAPGIVQRQNVCEPMYTGIKAIDTMVPIGRGQRELIIGDRKTGKTALAIDTILNQKTTGVKCIYVAIGQKQSTVAQVHKKLEEAGAMDYTCIIAANASDPATLQYLAPYVGATMGEYFMYKGEHVLIIYDDLTKQAQAYRQISLLLRRPPGREAFPGDVFYIHSRLLERSAKLSEKEGGGSLTALPIIETQAGDLSAYIPTNVISITDGQIFLDTNLFNSGQRPAIDVGLSVSRVGGDAQIKATKQVAGSLRLSLAQYRELEAFSQFSSDLDEITRKQLSHGQIMTHLLRQDQYRPYDISKTVLIIFAGMKNLLDGIDIKDLSRFEEELIDFAENQHGEVLQKIVSQQKLDADLEQQLTSIIEELKKNNFQ